MLIIPMNRLSRHLSFPFFKSAEWKLFGEKNFFDSNYFRHGHRNRGGVGSGADCWGLLSRNAPNSIRWAAVCSGAIRAGGIHVRQQDGSDMLGGRTREQSVESKTIFRSAFCPQPTEHSDL